MSRDTIQPMITRRNFIKGVGLVSASAALAACSQAPQGTNQKPATPLLAIIHTNDTHGHDVAVEADEDIEGNFSIAAVAALKRDWEKKGYNVLLVDAGDAMQGMPLVDTTDGASAITFMNACGYDLMAPGNHEFDWSIESLAANEKAAKFPPHLCQHHRERDWRAKVSRQQGHRAHKRFEGGLLWTHDASDLKRR